ncbi:hypothetical protein KSC_100640 [Ktedonobacter sp. SOSP1-52]|nr:hypothetical protein KSC_100640 [Ktedonobacter sp. SOSP1-52]
MLSVNEKKRAGRLRLARALLDLDWGSLYLWIRRARTPGAPDLVLGQQFFREGLPFTANRYIDTRRTDPAVEQTQCQAHSSSMSASPKNQQIQFLIRTNHTGPT